MAIDASIPLSGTPMPSFAQQVGQTYQMANLIEQQKEQKALRQDQQIIQDYLRQGGDLNTPAGLEKTVNDLKGKVTPKTYMTLSQAQQDALKNESAIELNLAKMPGAILQSMNEQFGAAAMNFEGVLTNYNKVAGEIGQPAALETFRQDKEKVLQSLTAQKLPGTNKPMYPPQVMQKFAAAETPEQLQTVIGQTKYIQERQKRALELQQKEQAIKTAQASEASSRALTAVREKELAMMQGGQEDEQLNNDISLALTGMPRTQIMAGRGKAAMRRWMQVQSGAINRLMEENPGMTRDQAALEFANRQAVRKSDVNALAAITKDITSIMPYEQMLNTNAEISINLAKNLMRTDSRVANRSLNWMRQNMGDNPDTAEFLAQTRFVQTEAARVLNNPRLVGQLTDTARREMEDVISGDMPLKSYIRVIKRIQIDGKNRVNAMISKQQSLLKGGGGGKVKTKSVPKLSTAVTSTQKSGPREFKTVAEANAANLPDNTPVIIGGRKGVWRK